MVLAAVETGASRVGTSRDATFAPLLRIVDAMIVLSLTGALLWTRLHRRRLIGLAIAATSVAVTISLAVAAS